MAIERQDRLEYERQREMAHPRGERGVARGPKLHGILIVGLKVHRAAGIVIDARLGECQRADRLERVLSEVRRGMRVLGSLGRPDLPVAGQGGLMFPIHAPGMQQAQRQRGQRQQRCHQRQ